MSPAAPPVTASAALRAAGRDAWAAAVRHPMVGAIAAGALPHDTFRRYFEQNVRYLEDYARAIALVTAKAPDRPALDVLSRFGRQIVATEIPANLAFLERLGGSAGRLPGPGELHPVAYGYTRHLLYVCAQAPQNSLLNTATRLPAVIAVPEPASTTIPAASWPSVIGYESGLIIPSMMCRSVPQTPAACTRISASPGPGRGVSTSSQPTVRS